MKNAIAKIVLGAAGAAVCALTLIWWTHRSPEEIVPGPSRPPDAAGEPLSSPSLPAISEKPWNPKLKLLGTIVGQGLTSSAFIQDLEQGGKQVYYEDSPIATQQGVGVVVSIGRESVLLRKGKNDIVLRLSTDRPGEFITAPAAPPPLSPLVGSKRGQEKPRMDREMDREEERRLKKQWKKERQEGKAQGKGGFRHWLQEEEGRGMGASITGETGTSPLPKQQ